MKYLSVYIISAILFCTVGCKNKHVVSTQQDNAITSTENNENENKTFRKDVFKKFINVDNSIIDNGERSFLQMIEIAGEKNEINEGWYRENVAHIDSISIYCIELSENGKEEELLQILTSELENFQSHPVATTYVCFDLNLILTRLYMEQSDTHPDYLQKCIDIWELNRLQINAVQSDWHEYHPLYTEVLNILLKLYEKVENPQKVAEMKELLSEVIDQS